MTPAKFWTQVEKTADCWVWRGEYGQRSGDHGRVYVNQRLVLAHRYAWELTNGPIPGDALVCHHCDNRPCVRPDHLYLGSKKTNARDLMLRNPASAGAKMTFRDAERIRALSLRGVNRFDIAEVFDLHPATVHKILRGKLWGGGTESC